MTVKKLIEILNEYPQDATIEVEDEHGRGIELIPVYYPNLNCVFFEA